MTPVLCAPLRVEQAALRRAAPALRVIHTGMGPRRSAAAADRLPSGGSPLLVAGVGGGTSEDVRPGDIVVASELVAGPRRVTLPSAPLLASALRGLGLTVHTGPVACAPRVVDGSRRAVIGGSGALAVDTESIQFADVAGSAAFAVVRSIVDTPDKPLWRVGTLPRGLTALRTLRASVPALRQWAAASLPREISLAAPLSFRAVAARADLVLVVGSRNSSNSQRLVEVAERDATPAYLVEDVSEVDLRWLAGVRRIGITAGASAPQPLVHELVHCLAGLGPTIVRENKATDEEARFTFPKKVS
jgi:4-hydroxy-3-methylbut-2-en-1-yl diphosphate reductase